MEKTRRGVKAQTQANEKAAYDDGVSRAIAVILGVLIGYAMFFIIIIAYSSLITYSSFTLEHLQMVLWFTVLLSTITAGCVAAMGAQTLGWLWGLITGGLCALILLVILFLLGKEFSLWMLGLMLTSALGGCLGGILGINMRKRARR